MDHPRFRPKQFVYVRGWGEGKRRQIISALTPSELEHEFLSRKVQPLLTDWPHYWVEDIPQPVSMLRLSTKPISLK
jgi:hypothetical protein